MKMKYSATVLIAVICASLSLPLTGCTASQAKVNQAVQDIQTWAPVIAADSTALLTDIASFTPSDAAAINSFVATMNADVVELTALCTQYLAGPSSSLLAQISALISQLASSDSSALLAVLQIKDPVSQKTARGVLTTIATAVTIMSGYLTVVGSTVTPAGNTALNDIRPYVDRVKLGNELQVAKDQGLVSSFATLEMAGF